MADSVAPGEFQAISRRSDGSLYSAVFVIVCCLVEVVDVTKVHISRRTSCRSRWRYLP